MKVKINMPGDTQSDGFGTFEKQLEYFLSGMKKSKKNKISIVNKNIKDKKMIKLKSFEKELIKSNHFYDNLKSHCDKYEIEEQKLKDFFELKDTLIFLDVVYILDSFKGNLRIFDSEDLLTIKEYEEIYPPLEIKEDTKLSDFMTQLKNSNANLQISIDKLNLIKNENNEVTLYKEKINFKKDETLLDERLEVILEEDEKSL